MITVVTPSSPLAIATRSSWRNAIATSLRVAVAPFAVHLAALRGGDAVADELYRALNAAGLDVLYDDRDERPGVKFADADLIGAPIRATVGERSLAAGGVELRARTTAASTAAGWPPEGAIVRIADASTELQKALAAIAEHERTAPNTDESIRARV